MQEPCGLVDGCLVHSGFNTGYDEIAATLIDAVKKAHDANPTYKIVFTGHSLGAAMATLSAANLRARGYAIDIYSYGSPRVGNRAFAEFVTKQPGTENRLTHGNDPVPRLPPIFTNYRHTSPEYWLEDGPSTRIDYTPADIKVCDGYANLGCNAGSLGLDIEAHNFYLTPIASCSPDGTPWKKRFMPAANQDMTDAELEAKLNEYVEKDIETLSSMGGDIWG